MEPETNPNGSCHDHSLGALAETPPPRRRVRHSKAQFVALFAGISAILLAASVAAYLVAPSPTSMAVPPGATVYYNEACSDCAVYLNGELLPGLRERGFEPVVVKDYINDRRYRAELTALNDALGIPFSLQSHLATFVRTDRLVVFEGHVPASLVVQSLGPAPGAPPRLLLYQDSMGSIVSYQAWAFAGAPQEYGISEPIATYYSWLSANPSTEFGSGSVLPIVLVTGFLDGLNPCAFAVLLFFVAFLYAVRAPRPDVLRTGTLYVYAVFLVYFLIGLGLMQAILLSGDPHLMAKLGAALVIVLGGLTLASFASPRIPLIAKMPAAAWSRIRTLLLRGSLPAATVSGIAVGLCTFPCSGGIYVAILGFLASRTTFLEGLGYLYLYNLMFILPLVATMGVASNRHVALRMARWEREHARPFKAAMAASMIAMGAIILALVL